jgi:hypothetical protein
LIKKKQKIKATKIPPAQSDRLTNATFASKTVVNIFPFSKFCYGFSIRLPASVRKSLQTFTLVRLVCGLSLRTCAGIKLISEFQNSLFYIVFKKHLSPTMGITPDVSRKCGYFHLYDFDCKIVSKQAFFNPTCFHTISKQGIFEKNSPKLVDTKKKELSHLLM